MVILVSDTTCVVLVIRKSLYVIDAIHVTLPTLMSVINRCKISHTTYVIILVSFNFIKFRGTRSLDVVYGSVVCPKDKMFITTE